MLRAELLDAADLAPVLLTMAAGIKPDDLYSMANAFTNGALESRVLAVPEEQRRALDVAEIVDEARRMAALRNHCTDGDRFLPNLDALAAWANRLATAPDDPARLALLVEAAGLRWSYGRKANWALLRA